MRSLQELFPAETFPYFNLLLELHALTLTETNELIQTLTPILEKKGIKTPVCAILVKPEKNLIYFMYSRGGEVFFLGFDLKTLMVKTKGADIELRLFLDGMKVMARSQPSDVKSKEISVTPLQEDKPNIQNIPQSDTDTYCFADYEMFYMWSGWLLRMGLVPKANSSQVWSLLEKIKMERYLQDSLVSLHTAGRLPLTNCYGVFGIAHTGNLAWQISLVSQLPSTKQLSEFQNTILLALNKSAEISGRISAVWCHEKGYICNSSLSDRWESLLSFPQKDQPAVKLEDSELIERIIAELGLSEGWCLKMIRVQFDPKPEQGKELLFQTKNWNFITVFNNQQLSQILNAATSNGIEFITAAEDGKIKTTHSSKLIEISSGLLPSRTPVVNQELELKSRPFIPSTSTETTSPLSIMPARIGNQQSFLQQAAERFFKRKMGNQVHLINHPLDIFIGIITSQKKHLSALQPLFGSIKITPQNIENKIIIFFKSVANTHFIFSVLINLLNHINKTLGLSLDGIGVFDLGSFDAIEALKTEALKKMFGIITTIHDGLAAIILDKAAVLQLIECQRLIDTYKTKNQVYQREQKEKHIRPPMPVLHDFCACLNFYFLHRYDLSAQVRVFLKKNKQKHIWLGQEVVRIVLTGTYDQLSPKVLNQLELLAYFIKQQFPALFPLIIFDTTKENPFRIKGTITYPNMMLLLYAVKSFLEHFGQVNLSADKKISSKKIKALFAAKERSLPSASSLSSPRPVSETPTEISERKTASSDWLQKIIKRNVPPRESKEVGRTNKAESLKLFPKIWNSFAPPEFELYDDQRKHARLILIGQLNSLFEDEGAGYRKMHPDKAWFFIPRIAIGADSMRKWVEPVRQMIEKRYEMELPCEFKDVTTELRTSGDAGIYFTAVGIAWDDVITIAKKEGGDLISLETFTIFYNIINDLCEKLKIDISASNNFLTFTFKDPNAYVVLSSLISENISDKDIKAIFNQEISIPQDILSSYPKIFNLINLMLKCCYYVVPPPLNPLQIFIPQPVRQTGLDGSYSEPSYMQKISYYLYARQGGQGAFSSSSDSDKKSEQNLEPVKSLSDQKSEQNPKLEKSLFEKLFLVYYPIEWTPTKEGELKPILEEEWAETESPVCLALRKDDFIYFLYFDDHGIFNRSITHVDNLTIAEASLESFLKGKRVLATRLDTMGFIFSNYEVFFKLVSVASKHNCLYSGKTNWQFTEAQTIKFIWDKVVSLKNLKETPLPFTTRFGGFRVGVRSFERVIFCPKQPESDEELQKGTVYLMLHDTKILALLYLERLNDSYLCLTLDRNNFDFLPFDFPKPGQASRTIDKKNHAKILQQILTLLGLDGGFVLAFIICNTLGIPGIDHAYRPNDTLKAQWKCLIIFNTVHLEWAFQHRIEGNKLTGLFSTEESPSKVQLIHPGELFSEVLEYKTGATYQLCRPLIINKKRIEVELPVLSSVMGNPGYQPPPPFPSRTGPKVGQTPAIAENKSSTITASILAPFIFPSSFSARQIHPYLKAYAEERSEEIYKSEKATLIYSIREKYDGVISYLVIDSVRAVLDEERTFNLIIMHKMPIPVFLREDGQWTWDNSDQLIVSLPKTILPPETAALLFELIVVLFKELGVQNMRQLKPNDSATYLPSLSRDNLNQKFDPYLYKNLNDFDVAKIMDQRKAESNYTPIIILTTVPLLTDSIRLLIISISPNLFEDMIFSSLYDLLYGLRYYLRERYATIDVICSASKKISATELIDWIDPPHKDPMHEKKHGSIEDSKSSYQGPKYDFHVLTQVEKNALLFTAIREGKLKKVQELIRNGASLTELDSDYGHTPLITAAIWGHVHIAEYLLAAKADPNAKSIKGTTAIEYAEKSRNAAIVDLLNRIAEKQSDAKTREPGTTSSPSTLPSGLASSRNTFVSSWTRPSQASTRTPSETSNSGGSGLDGLSSASSGSYESNLNESSSNTSTSTQSSR